MKEDRFEWILQGLDRDGLNDWEKRFVQSCEESFEEYGNITRKMEAKLEEIYRERGR